MKKKLLAVILSLMCCMQSGTVLTSVAEDSAPAIDYESSEYLEASSISDKIQDFMSANGYQGLTSVQYVDGEFQILILLEKREVFISIWRYCEANGWTSQVSMTYHTFHAAQCLDYCSRIEQFIEEQNYPEEYDFSVVYHESENDNEDYILVTCTDETALEEVKNFYESLGYEWCETRFQLGSSEISPSEEAFENEDMQPMTEETMNVVITAGDVSLDNSVDIMDVILLNRAILGKESLSYLQNQAADVNHDDKVDSDDALRIMKMIVGLY